MQLGARAVTTRRSQAVAAALMSRHPASWSLRAFTEPSFPVREGGLCKFRFLTLNRRFVIPAERRRDQVRVGV